MRRKAWLDTESDEEAWNRSNQFAHESRNSIHYGIGEFWADEIKRYRELPDKRLEVALENLPLPAAFREAKIALRAIIRSNRKLNLGYQKELLHLYQLAAIESYSIPYSQRLKLPGYNIIDHTPGRRLSALPFSYKTLGYERLGLTKTDIKWIVELWGEPKRHSTLHEDFHVLWLEQENKFALGLERKLMELTDLPGFEV